LLLLISYCMSTQEKKNQGATKGNQVKAIYIHCIWWTKTLHPAIRGGLKSVMQKCTDQSYHLHRAVSARKINHLFAPQCLQLYPLLTDVISKTIFGIVPSTGHRMVSFREVLMKHAKVRKKSKQRNIYHIVFCLV